MSQIEEPYTCTLTFDDFFTFSDQLHNKVAEIGLKSREKCDVPKCDMFPTVK